MFAKSFHIASKSFFGFAVVTAASLPLAASAQNCPLSSGHQTVVVANPHAVAVAYQAPATATADIVDTAVSAGSFNTLVAAVKAAGLVETLKGPGPFTVFAPTDDAFKKIPAETLQTLLKPENKAQLQGILTYHVVSGKVMAADVVGLESAKTVQGADVKITKSDSGVMINGANVIKTDIVCANGVIHVIDAVIMPPAKKEVAQAQAGSGTKTMTSAAPTADIVDTAVSAGSFTTLVAAVKAAGLVETLKGDGPFTVFAPSDEAFGKLPASAIQDLLKPENKDKLAGILTYHVVSGRVMAADAAGLTTAATVNGKSLQVTSENGGVQIGGANVVQADIKCKNGVIHVIDNVLMPE